MTKMSGKKVLAALLLAVAGLRSLTLLAAPTQYDTTSIIEWLKAHSGDIVIILVIITLLGIENPVSNWLEDIIAKLLGGTKHVKIGLLVLLAIGFFVLPHPWISSIIPGIGNIIPQPTQQPTSTPPPGGVGYTYLELYNIEDPTTAITSGVTLEVYPIGTFTSIYDYAKQRHFGTIPDPVGTGSYDSSEAKWKIKNLRPNTEYQLVIYPSSSTYWIPEIKIIRTGTWVDLEKIGGELVLLEPEEGFFKLAQFKAYQIEKTDGSETAISNYVLKSVKNATTSAGSFYFEFYVQLGIPSTQDNSRARDFAIFLEVLETSDECTIKIQNSFVWVEGVPAQLELASLHDEWSGAPSPTNVSYTVYRIVLPASVTNEIRRNTGKNINTKITLHFKLYVDWDRSNDDTADTFTVGRVIVGHMQHSSYINSWISGLYSEKAILLKIQDNQSGDAISYS